MASKTIVITGVTRGLGRAMLEGFHRRGHCVIGCGRNAEAIEELRRDYSKPHRFDSVDVTDDNAVKAWAADAISTNGPPDFLVNNAAVINRNAALWEISDAEFSSVIDINIKGVTNTIRHFVPSMIERQRGVIVNFSSGWGRSVSPEVAPYCATKWAIEGLSKALAAELPAGMAVVPFSPGVINTEMLQSCMGESAAHSPSPEQWAETAVPFLLDLNEEHNGQSLSVPI